MTRILKTLTTVSLGALLLTSVACQDKETEEALNTCRNDLSNEQKKEASQQTTIDELKAQLAAAQAKIADLTKESETAKNGKAGKAMEEKGEGGGAKKAEGAKPENEKAATKAEKMEKMGKKGKMEKMEKMEKKEEKKGEAAK
jgi:hypothetical protein